MHYNGNVTLVYSAAVSFRLDMMPHTRFTLSRSIAHTSPLPKPKLSPRRTTSELFTRAGATAELAVRCTSAKSGAASSSASSVLSLMPDPATIFRDVLGGTAVPAGASGVSRHSSVIDIKVLAPRGADVAWPLAGQSCHYDLSAARTL